ncbi:MAG: hypothetical protein GY745_08565 [Actinomycetia bacterium]|nr:hypothetical protein [Actinomycetes bacterium]
MTTTTLTTKTTDSIASTPGLINTIRSEWIRIWRPSFRYGGFGILAFFSVLISYFIYSSLAEPSATAGPPGPRGAATTAADLEQAGGMIHALGSISTLAGIVVLSLWAIAAASDYDSGLIRALVQAQPSRLRLLGGKIIALSFFTVLLSAATVFITSAVARPLARAYEIDTEPWKTDAAAEIASGFFNFLLPVLVWGLIGLMIAVLTRSSGTAIGVGIGWLLVVEGLIGIWAPDITHLLPGGTLSAFAAGGTADLSWASALGLTLLYGAVAASVSLLAFRNRDIVS